MQTIEMEFDDDGSPTITVKGVKGKGCKALTEALENDFGTEKTSTPTREYNEAEPVTRKQTKNA